MNPEDTEVVVPVVEEEAVVAAPADDEELAPAVEAPAEAE